MSSGNEDVLRDVAKEVLAELLPTLLEEALATPTRNGNGNGYRAHTPAPAVVSEDDSVVPQVPAPPIAKVHRPSGWRAPTPDEGVVEIRPPVALPQDVVLERVDLRSDADLNAFVHALARRLENARNRTAILSGKVRFQLAAAPGSPGQGASAESTIRVESGAVTERAVKDAARAGARLVLSPRAVLTPMARDRARSLGVEIEKEKPC
ncbi:MAG: hypothetical protein ACRDPV_01675 [Gaiellaceae bacterium]